jgi:hypothetical protein
MQAMELEEAREHLKALELAMLEGVPSAIELLRSQHIAAREALAEAERIEAEQRARVRRLPLSHEQLEQLWQEFRECKTHLRRSKLRPAAAPRYSAAAPDV